MTRNKRKPTPTWDQLKAYVEGALRRERKRADDRVAKALADERTKRERAESGIYGLIDVIALEVGKHRTELHMPSEQ